jgi:hypothetical protein
MTFEVILSPEARDAIAQQVDYLSTEGVPEDIIVKWLGKLDALCKSLEHSPNRFAVAGLESSRVGFEVRRCVFGDYLLFYAIAKSSGRVEIQYFRRGAKRPGSGFGDDPIG